MSRTENRNVVTELSTADLQALDKSHHLHPFTDLHSYAESGGRIISQAEHIYIRDSDGRQILDGMSGLWCCNLGNDVGSWNRHWDASAPAS